MTLIDGPVPSIAAHRGWHADGAPENSIAATEAAAANGVDLVETDIRRTRAGLVVFHDHRLDGKPLHLVTAEDLARYPEVVTLDEWARNAGSRGVRVLAEFKERGDEAEGLATLKRYVTPDDLAVMSFDPRVVRTLRTLEPTLPVGQLTYDLPLTHLVRQALAPGSSVHLAQRTGASFVALNVRQATNATLEAARRAGMGVAVWTVDDASTLGQLLGDARVTTVITDAPQLATNIRSALAGGLSEASAGVRLLHAATTMR